MTTGVQDDVVMVTEIKGNVDHYQGHSKSIDNHFSSEYGYVLGAHFSDQLTGGTVNVISLQCWAASLNAKVKVVEPFTRAGSILGFEDSFIRNTTSKDEYPRLYDYFDEHTWSSQTKKRHYPTVVTWEEFLSKAPRKIIIAGHYCDDIDDKMFAASTKFAVDNGFHILKKVCTNKKKRVSIQAYREMLYGPFKPNETVLFFIRWGGISSTETPYEFRFREIISGINQCTRGSLGYNSIFVPESQRIIKNGRRYIDKYLSSDVGYIGVMMRFEYLFIYHKLKTDADRISYGRTCIASILRKVEEIKMRNKITKVFLAMDAGKYGSRGFRLFNNSGADETLSAALFDGLYRNNSFSYQDWTESFSNVSDFEMPGFIAMIQQNVAANAKVLLRAGGGSFQVYADNMHRRFHPSKPDSHQLCQ